MVVIPDIDSKNESVKDIPNDENQKGRAPNVASESHTEFVRRNAWRVFTLNLCPILLKISEPPKNAVMIMHEKKTIQSS